MVPEQPLLDVDPGAGEREALHREAHLGVERRLARAVPVDRQHGREGLVVLQPVELPGLELAGGHRRVHHDLDDVPRQPVDLVDASR